ncbi:hypothetical protein SELMODRAFT_92077 [Selaginella moellendorffii]|uniref:Uncharacterized protein n=1 Tax=Selaginella moellendorffii TaxID=88036 RepID=D8RFF7_SELML|nr:hypothetical protein SELMODRAFT_92077 [Selaginella moellendorffii]
MLGFALVANASYLDTYSGLHCDKNTRRYDSCGCNNIDFKQQKGYKFVYTNGQSATAYSGTRCQKRAGVSFDRND